MNNNEHLEKLLAVIDNTHIMINRIKPEDIDEVMLAKLVKIQTYSSSMNISIIELLYRDAVKNKDSNP